MAPSSLAFARFMARPVGRAIRIIAGITLIGWGWTMRETTSGVVLMIVGLLPLLTGLFNVCTIAALIGAPFSGREALQDRPAEQNPR